jgi:uncharacterized protein (UPF0276 family)
MTTGESSERVIVPRPMTGVGLGLRWDFLQEVVDATQRLPIPFFEISPENYMRRGGYYPAALAAIRERYPMLSHGLMMNLGSSDPLDRDYLAALRTFLGHSKAPYHSDHLCWNGVSGQTLHDLLPLPLTRASLRNVVAQIQRAQDALGLPLAIENISFYAGLTAPPGIDEADFVAEVVDRAGCGLLLDVNNVQVNADNHGFDAIAYLQRLPLDKVVHLHIAGGERRPKLDNLIIDTHGTDVEARVTELMKWVIRRIGPVAVIYERDHNIPPLHELLAQLAAHQRAYDEAVEQWGLPHSLQEAEQAKGQTRAPYGSLELSLAQVSDREPQAEHEALLRSLSRGILAASELVELEEPANSELPSAQRRWWVYRKLVRNAITSTVADFLPKTQHNVGAKWAQTLDDWLDEFGPRSKYLRDIPGEFVECTKAIRDSALAYDLARYELFFYAVGAKEEATDAGPAEAIDLEAKLPLHPTATLLALDHAVHEWSLEASEAPPRRATQLLLYRDSDHEVRTLEISPAVAILAAYLQAGATLRDALMQAAQSEGETANGVIFDPFLERMSGVLADFGERGLLRKNA